MRKTTVIEVDDVSAFRLKLLQQAREEEFFVLLDSNNFEKLHPSNNSYNWIAAFGAHTIIDNESMLLSKVDEFTASQKDWLFGHLNYDYKNQLEKLSSSNTDHIRFPDFTFFQPQCVFIATRETVTLEYLPGFQLEIFLKSMAESKVKELKDTPVLRVEASETPLEYKRKIKTLQKHIHRGDIYEVNYCTEFHAYNASLTPVDVYRKLCDHAASPMATFYKHKANYLICGSPERYLKKEGCKLISQPIKGTIKRNSDAKTDGELITKLEKSLKDRTENIMIVDLVRNDLSRIADPSSVKVSELCKPYTFTHWHQLISTVEATVPEALGFHEIIQHTFPMGSMTGAPKYRAMQLIESSEEVKRGIYSGAVGYINPHGDFDFNVVIRSICYNSTNNYLSYIVGGAITAASDPQQEYEECLLKAKGIEKVLNVNKQHA